jgi:hypothetical protein
MRISRVVIPVLLASATSAALAVQGDYMPNADQVRAQYQALYAQQPTTQANGVVAFDKGRLLKYGGLNILYVHGDAFEMAYQHGRLLKDEIVDGVVPGAASLVKNEVTNLYGSTPLIRNTVYGVIDRNFYTKLLDNAFTRAGDMAETSIRMTAFAMSEASGLPMNTVFDAALSPSILMILAQSTNDGLLGGLIPGSGGGPAFAPMSNCSEFEAWGPRTADGELIIARNTDYPLNGKYDDHHTVIYFDPTTPGAQRYMSVISAGAHNAGVAAINASGIYIGSHTVPSTEVSTDAVPAYFVANAVIANAHTMDEALALFRAQKAESGWSFVVASVDEHRVVSVEVNAAGVAVREATGDYHVQTNHYLTAEKAGENLHINRGIADDSTGRYARLDQLVRAQTTPFDAPAAARLLADQVNPATGQVVGLPSTLAVMTTVSSMVIQPRAGVIYVANGKAPVPHNTYVKLPLPGAFDIDRLAATPLESFANGGFGQAHPQKLSAIRAFIEGKKAWEYDHDPAAARGFLQQAIALDPDTASYGLAEAVMALKDDDLDGGKATLDGLLAGATLSPHERAVATWLRGRIFAENGANAAARADFTAVRDTPGVDERLKAGAETGLASVGGVRRYRLNAEKLPWMFQFADFQNYK